MIVRKNKTKLDHITVEFLQKNHCFDMPLAVSGSADHLCCAVITFVLVQQGSNIPPYELRSSMSSILADFDLY